MDILVGVLGFLVSAPISLLWLFWLLPLASRPVGIRLSIGINRTRWIQEIGRLSAFPRIVLIGIMGWGVCLLLATTGSDYMRWRYFGGSFHFPWDSVGFCALCGASIGWSQRTVQP
jgi:hypothetical protein